LKNADIGVKKIQIDIVAVKIDSYDEFC